jgi:hypothetical protein
VSYTSQAAYHGSPPVIAPGPEPGSETGSVITQFALPVTTVAVLGASY